MIGCRNVITIVKRCRYTVLEPNSGLASQAVDHNRLVNQQHHSYGDPVILEIRQKASRCHFYLVITLVDFFWMQEEQCKDQPWWKRDAAGK